MINITLCQLEIETVSISFLAHFLECAVLIGDEIRNQYWGNFLGEEGVRLRVYVKGGGYYSQWWHDYDSCVYLEGKRQMSLEKLKFDMRRTRGMFCKRHPERLILATRYLLGYYIWLIRNYFYSCTLTNLEPNVTEFSLVSFCIDLIS